jgi:hypothetical protein
MYCYVQIRIFIENMKRHINEATNKNIVSQNVKVICEIIEFKNVNNTFQSSPNPL